MSSEYVELIGHIDELTKLFCTDDIISHQIDDKSQFMLTSYMILVHAEFESYIETMIYNKIDSELNEFNITGKITNSLASCAAFSPIKYGTSSKAKEIKSTLKSIVNENVNILKKEIVEGNNGIKQSNIISFLQKLDIDLKDIDELYFIELDNFGEERGNSAHHGKGIRKLVDYSTLKTRIQHIIDFFGILDSKFRE